MPPDLPRFRAKIEIRSRQGRHVQRLTDRANAVRCTAVLVNKDAASGEIQQGHTAQDGQRALAGDKPDEIHVSKGAHDSVAP